MDNINNINKIKRLGSAERYSEAVIYGDLIFLSGMIPEIPENIPNTIYNQTNNVLNQIDNWLEQCGSDKSHILEASIFLSNMDDYDEMNRAWDNWVDKNNPPARACVETKLARPNWGVEIKISAVKK